MHALERFDVTQGHRSLPMRCSIRGSMLDELRSRDWVPRSVRRQAREMTKAIGALEQSLGGSATEPEIAKALDIDLAEYRQALLDTNNSQLFSYDEWHEIHGKAVSHKWMKMTAVTR